jgi:hypothetical protein
VFSRFHDGALARFVIWLVALVRTAGPEAGCELCDAS